MIAYVVCSYPLQCSTACKLLIHFENFLSLLDYSAVENTE